jgi:MYXO-CTERM domain-containing protein
MKLHNETTRFSGMVSVRSTSRRQYSVSVLLLGVLLCAAPISAALAQTTINAGDVADVMPGTTADIPISIVLPEGTPCATLQFNLTVMANGGAPAIDTNVTFASAVGPPSQNINNGPGTRLVGWFSNFDPLLTGTTAVGTLSVPIPAGASSGQTYTVQVINPSGTTDGENDLPMTGVNGTITIGGAPTMSTVNAGDVSANAGSTAEVPISIVLLPDTPCATLQFNLTVVANGGAPAIDTNIGFDSAVGPPSQNINNGPATRLVGWFSNFDPLLTGSTAVGTLTVPIPAGAANGQTYTVQVINPSGTTDGETDLPLTGVNGTIMVSGGGGPTETPTQTPTPTTPVVVETSTPTATRTNTPVQATPTGTRTPTPTAGAPTPAPFDDDGGCQINAAGGSATGWLLLLPAIGLLALRRKQR